MKRGNAVVLAYLVFSANWEKRGWMGLSEFAIFANQSCESANSASICTNLGSTFSLRYAFHHMRNSTALQAAIFSAIKDQLPAHLSLVDEVSDLLSVSTDSAYRRIRGQTAMSVEEAGVLARRFNLSIDRLVGANTPSISFSYQPLDEASYNFVDYLRTIRDDLRMIDSFQEKQVLYLANDLPFFHLLQVPEIAAFKMFFWEKTILDFKSRAGQKFGLEVRNAEVNEICREIREVWCRIPTVEVYGSDAVSYTLRQIGYYHESGLFANADTGKLLCDKLEEAVNHLEAQAGYGRKFSGAQVPEAWKETPGENYKLYFNEVLHVDNTVLVKAGDFMATYLTNNGLNSLSTVSEAFYRSSRKAVNVLLRKSTLISGTSEKERSKAFRGYRKSIEEERGRLV